MSKNLDASRWKALGEIYLRPLVLADAEALEEAVTANLDYLKPWMPWASFEPLSIESRRTLVSSWEHSFAKGTEFNFGIFSPVGLLGISGLMTRVAPSGLEIGYWVREEVRGRGIAQGAAAALALLALSKDEITHVEIHHDLNNLASARIPAKLGFKKVRETKSAILSPGESGVTVIWRFARGSQDVRALWGTDLPVVIASGKPADQAVGDTGLVSTSPSVLEDY